MCWINFVLVRHIVYKHTEAGCWLVAAWGQFWKRSARWGVVKHGLMPTGPLSLVPGIRGQGAPICQTCAMPNSFPWLTHTASHPHSSTQYTADRWQWTGIACQACCFTHLRVHPCLDLTLSTPVCWAHPQWGDVRVGTMLSCFGMAWRAARIMLMCVKN